MNNLSPKINFKNSNSEPFFYKINYMLKLFYKKKQGENKQTFGLLTLFSQVQPVQLNSELNKYAY